MEKRLLFIVLLALLLLSACAPAAATSSRAPAFDMNNATNGSAGKSSEAFAGQAPAAPVAPAAMDANAMVLNPQVNPDGKRLVIRNANLTIVVEDPAMAQNAVSRMAETMQGFVVSSNLYKSSGQNGQEFPEASITVRVPADKLNDALDQIRALVKDPGNDVRSETVSGQDVTKEYTDLQSRLRNLQDTEAQLREIMGSATKTEDVLSVYNQLSQIREQIEVTKGQIQYYEESAALSSISVLIQAQASVQPLEIGGWKPVGEARSAVQSLINTMQLLGSAVIWLALYVLPVALVIFLPLRLLWMLWQRSRKNRKAQPPVIPPAPTPS